jgi:uncharacterized protein (DUF2235 family)/phage tail protein X
MKRLVFCFDGSWNQLNAPNPTNVVIVGESIRPITKDGIRQIIHYDPGVGTGVNDKWQGGLFGDGVIDKIVDGYAFLLFNYEPGDEIFVFGFSRGAFTARAFVGMIRQIGIIQRKHANRIGDAVELYKQHKPGEGNNIDPLLKFRAELSPELCVDQEEDAWRVANLPNYTTGSASVLRIKYVGVWDTVAALGVPSDVFFAPWANAGDQYFDSDLSPLVVSARHAVSINEDRVTFTPTLWPNFEELNTSLGFAPAAADAPYQQKWFPGDHGSVGGGGNIRGLSDRSLSWVLDGALKMGLEVDLDPQSPLFDLMPDDFAPLQNMIPAPPNVQALLEGVLLRRTPRQQGPAKLEEVSTSALRRWREPADNLPEKHAYRPSTLAGVAALIDANPPPPVPQSEHPATPPAAAPTPGALYKIVYGDQLRVLAQRLYGHADCADAIVSANPTVTDPDRIFVGQIIYLPPIDRALKSLPGGGAKGPS